jgi:hypothetical protein
MGFSSDNCTGLRSTQASRQSAEALRSNPLSSKLDNSAFSQVEYESDGRDDWGQSKLIVPEAQSNMCGCMKANVVGPEWDDFTGSRCLCLANPRTLVINSTPRFLDPQSEHMA